MHAARAGQGVRLPVAVELRCPDARGEGPGAAAALEMLFTKVGFHVARAADA
jgi:hypothetical protein